MESTGSEELSLGRCQYVVRGRRCEGEVVEAGGYYCERHLVRVGEVPVGAVKAGFLPEVVRSRYYGVVGDVLKNLEESIEVQRAMERMVLERLSGPGSLGAWERLRREVSREEVDVGEVRRIVNGEGDILREVMEVYEVIGRLHEGQRKLTETLVRCRGELQKSYTREQWNRLMASVVELLRARVDERVLRDIANEMVLLTAKQVPEGG